MIKRPHGFTLIESIIVIVVMGIAMLTIVYFLSPQITRSADPHYQSRASALGQSVMGQILSRNFDEQNNQLGGDSRCDSTSCSGFTSTPLGPDGTETPSQYDDVDDYIGCWTTSTPLGACKDLNLLLTDSGKESGYHNFDMTVDVVYFGSCTPDNLAPCSNSNAKMLKRIDMTITAGSQPPFTLTAYRGNY